MPHFPPVGVTLAALVGDISSPPAVESSPVVSQHDLTPVGVPSSPTVEYALSLKVEIISPPPGFDISPVVVQVSSPVVAVVPPVQENVTSDDDFLHLNDVVDDPVGAAALAPAGSFW